MSYGLKGMVVSFYNNSNDYYLIKGVYCLYDIYRVKIAIRFLQNILPYPVFKEYLFDYLVSIVREKKEVICYDHLHYYDCLNFTPHVEPAQRAKKLIHLYYNKSNLYDSFRILEVFEVASAYGYNGIGYHMIFCSSDGKRYKVWLPKSCFNTIRDELTLWPTKFNNLLHKVYFRIVEICEYKGNKYPRIECKTKII